jgi:hypothetical protein
MDDQDPPPWTLKRVLALIAVLALLALSFWFGAPGKDEKPNPIEAIDHG